LRILPSLEIGTIKIERFCHLRFKLNMSVPKLLKRPARLLLITFVATSGFTVSAVPSAQRMSSSSSHRQNAATNTRARARQDMLFRGVDRWGLNE